MNKFSHIDSEGKARMVDVSGKSCHREVGNSKRFRIDEAGNSSFDFRQKHTQGRSNCHCEDRRHYGCKKKAELIPMCHPLNLSSVAVEITVEESRVRIEARAKTVGQTSVSSIFILATDP